MHRERMHPSCVGAATLATGLTSSLTPRRRPPLALSNAALAVDESRHPPRAHADYDNATLSTSMLLSTHSRKVVATTDLIVDTSAHSHSNPSLCICGRALGFTNGTPRFVLTNPRRCYPGLATMQRHYGGAAQLHPTIHRYKTT
jgi:hypothetical protein